jgi:hypothetical protein
MTIETPYTTEDVLRAHNAEIASPPLPPATDYDDVTMDMFYSAKKAGISNDARSRRIVTIQNRERAEKCGDKPIAVFKEHSQTNIMDF